MARMLVGVCWGPMVGVVGSCERLEEEDKREPWRLRWLVIRISAE